MILQGLEDGSLTPDGNGTDVVLIDNSPGSSATANIMSLLRGWSGEGEGRNHAVCVVTTPRVADIVNSAYELTWLQAARTEPEDTQPVYWIGNMWSCPISIEDILMNGLGLVFKYIMGGDDNPAVANAMRFAGLHSEDEQRISTVLKYAELTGRIIPSTLKFTPDLRPLFDFSVDARPAVEALEAIDKLLRSLENWRLFSELDLAHQGLRGGG